MMVDGVENDVGWVWVTCYLEHRNGHAEKLELEGPPGDLSANTPTQNMQTTASYLKRQSLLAITGTSTGGEDDEANMRNDGGMDPMEGVPEALIQNARDASLGGWLSLAKFIKACTETQRLMLDPISASLKEAALKADESAKGNK
jgi:hypothetical protein